MKLIKLIILLFFSLNAFAQKRVIHIKIDPDKTYQTIDGFGASDAWRCQFVGKNWPLEKRNAIADLLFSKEFDKKGDPKGIGLSIWRFYLSACTAEQGDSSGISNMWRRGECFQNKDGSYGWKKQAGQQWFLEAAKKRGVEKLLAFTIAAPVHMSDNGKGFAEKGNIHFNVAPGKMDDYAKYVVDVVEHFEKNGYHFDYLSPFNEPQWNWDNGNQEGTPGLNEELYAFVKYLSHELNTRRLNTQLVIGEAGTITHLSKTVNNDGRDNQVKFFFDPESSFYIGDLPNVRNTISSHSYFTVWPVENQVDTRKELAEQLNSVNKSIGYWQSEYCVLQKNDEIGQGSGRDLGMSTALYIARIIHNDLTLTNASSWQWWTALTQFDYKDGLIYLNSKSGEMGSNVESLKHNGEFHDSKLLWTFGNYSRFIRPGMVRINVENISYPDPVSASYNVMISAYLNPLSNNIVMVIVNETDENKKLIIDNAAGWGQMNFTGYLTSSRSNLKRQKINVNDVVLPARSVLTIVE